MLLRALHPPAPVDGGYLQALRSEVSAVMEPRVLRSYSLDVASVEVRPLPNAQSVATPGPNPQALEVGARRLVWTGTGAGHAGQPPRVHISTPHQACRSRSPSQIMGSPGGRCANIEAIMFFMVLELAFASLLYCAKPHCCCWQCRSHSASARAVARLAVPANSGQRQARILVQPDGRT